ncbi:MAG: hypothetical protein JNN15_03185 [Blastocatellia bacterium]|nr:hypothetical protein [Blastocatellia bacterium]
MKNLFGNKGFRSSLLALLAVFTFTILSDTAHAQYYPYGRDRDIYYDDDDDRFSIYEQRVAFNNGYQIGYGQGANDRSYGNRYDVSRNKAYRDGDSGYRDSFGDKDDYKRIFRSGYEQGYRDGYDGYRRRGVSNRNNRDRYDRIDRRDRRDRRDDRCDDNRRNNGRRRQPVVVFPY